jgi:hypothetical protein
MAGNIVENRYRAAHKFHFATFLSGTERARRDRLREQPVRRGLIFQPAALVLDHLMSVTVMRPLTRSAVNSIA